MFIIERAIIIRRVLGHVEEVRYVTSLRAFQRVQIIELTRLQESDTGIIDCA